MLRPKDLSAGTVLHWHRDLGWGVLVSPEVEGTIFAHISGIRDQAGERHLDDGQTVYFTWEHYPPLQDGCPNRALEVYSTPHGEPVPPTEHPPGAYESTLVIEWDDDKPPSE